MKVGILGAGAWLPGEPETWEDCLLGGRPLAESAWRGAGEPARPPGFEAGAWRRMSRLSRAVAATAAPLLVEGVDLHGLPVVWGTALGELVPTGRFLQRLFTEGPERVSPLAFQSSVYNAAAGQLSIALGLRGPSETVAAGGATGLSALMRGVDLVRLGAPAVLVLAGDDLNEVLRTSLELLGDERAYGEAVGAVLLGPADGRAVEVAVGLGAGEGERALGRCGALPGEGAFGAPEVDVVLEDSLGLVASGGLAVLAALVGAVEAGRLPGLRLVEQDDGHVLHAVIRAPRGGP